MDASNKLCSFTSSESLAAGYTQQQPQNILHTKDQFVVARGTLFGVAYIVCNEVDVQLSMEVDADVEQSFGACCRLAATAPIQNGSCDISFVTLLHSTVATTGNFKKHTLAGI